MAHDTNFRTSTEATPAAATPPDPAETAPEQAEKTVQTAATGAALGVPASGIRYRRPRGVGAAAQSPAGRFRYGRVGGAGSHRGGRRAHAGARSLRHLRPGGWSPEPY